MSPDRSWAWCRTLGMGSERQERLKALGVRLRGLRVRAGLTGAALAERAGVGQPTVSKVENGRMVPSSDVLNRLTTALGLDEATTREVRELLAAAEEASPESPGERAPGAELYEVIQRATVVRSLQCIVLPALLQSAEYARHVFATGPKVDSEGIGSAVAGRIERQSLLYEPGREFVFVLTEGVLRTWPGSPALMLAQLDRLLAIESLTTVRLGVVPWDRPVPALPLHGYTLCDDQAVIVESFVGEDINESPESVTACSDLLDRFEQAAVFGEGVRRILLDVMADLRAMDDTSTP